MSLFGKKDAAKTVLILDIENGSVGSALARLSADGAPQLFGESRARVPLMETHSALQLARAVGHAALESILGMSEVAARLRHRTASDLAPVSEVVVFLAAPWGVPNLSVGRPDFSTTLTEALEPRIHSLFDAPVAWHAHASAAVHGLRSLYPQEHQALLVSVNGEVTELVVLNEGRVRSHATAPVGLGSILRTLKAHAGLSEAEARSALHLASHAEGAHTEALRTATEHFVSEFKDVARDAFAGQDSSSVFVLAPEPTEPWFARALAHESLSELFPQGGMVRAMRHGHAAPYVSTQSPHKDIHLLLDALYVNASRVVY